MDECQYDIQILVKLSWHVVRTQNIRKSALRNGVEFDFTVTFQMFTATVWAHLKC